MRKTLTDLGLDGTSLVIRDMAGKEKQRFKGQDLRRLMGILEQVEEYLKIVERRGMPFARMLELRRQNKKMPSHRVVLDGKENLFFDGEDYEEFIEKNKISELEAQAHAV